MVTIGGKYLKVEDIEKVLFSGESIELNEDAVGKVEENYCFLEDFSRGKVIYGLNTGFGPMAQYRISREDQIQLQYNLIRSHASGGGELLSQEEVKALMLARLNTFMLGKSGVHPELVFLLKDFINFGIYPCIYTHGGVGASGDLVQLAHLALALIGEGEAFYQEERRPVAEVMEQIGLDPLNIYMREGLALMNGTSVMTGVGIVNLIKARKAFNWSVLASAMLNELVCTYDDHFSVELNQVKQHKGQQEVAAMLRCFLKDSQLVKRRDEHLYKSGRDEEKVFKEKVQEYYSLRCVPQIAGPVLDTLEYAQQVVEAELNSASDNPIVDGETQNVYHGGNFHGDYVSFEMDKLKIAMTKLSMLVERQLNFTMNHKINEILPPFVNHGTLGLNFGMQGAQFTAVSTVAENQSLSFPNYVHSIPNNNDNQDIVSMGTNSAVLAGKVINNCFEVLAIQFVSLIQAIDLLGVQDKISSLPAKLYQDLREQVPVFKEDPVLYPILRKVEAYLKAQEVMNLSPANGKEGSVVLG
jgi:histidine ammonia-lyase